MIQWLQMQPCRSSSTVSTSQMLLVSISQAADNTSQKLEEDTMHHIWKLAHTWRLMQGTRCSWLKKKRLSSRFCESWWCKLPWFQDMICFIVGSTSRKWPTNMIWDSWLNHAAACTDMPLKRKCISASGSSVAIFTESNNLIGSY